MAAESGFVLGLVALCSAPFSVMYGVTLATGAVGFLCSLVGLAATSRPYVAGRALAPAGVFLAAVALGMLGLRYLQLDTAFGDGLLPTIRAWLDALNSRLPVP